MKVTGPRAVAFWGSLCLILLVLCAVGHESWEAICLWGMTVAAVWTTAIAAFFANRQAPVHRGSFARPTSSSTSLLLALALLLGALAGVYGLWFGIMVPVPVAIAIYGIVRDRKLYRRMVDSGDVDPTAPPYLARAGRPHELAPWPEPGRDGSG